MALAPHVKDEKGRAMLKAGKFATGPEKSVAIKRAEKAKEDKK